MWLLPPDFPDDAFDLPPGTWALPWYANEQHIDALMRLLLAGEARIREWQPLPWAAIEGLGSDGRVRHGAALVLQVPTELEPSAIVERAQSLPWPYVFWRSPRPAFEGNGAWIEREIKRVVLSEVHRGLLDPEHPLARFHVERLPMKRLASMVGDPVELLEIAQAALLHRLEHARDGLRREDYEHSVRWEAGRRLGEHLLRMPPEQREQALLVLRRGGRGQEERGDFRRTAQWIQDVGLGLLVAEDLALGPLARSMGDPIVAAGVADRLPEEVVVEVGVPFSTLAPDLRALPKTHVTLPSVELTTHDFIKDWLLELVAAAAKRDKTWSVPWVSVTHGIHKPRTLEDRRRDLHELAALDAKDHKGQKLRELFSLLLRTGADNRWDLHRTRESISALIHLVEDSSRAKEIFANLEALLIERALVQSPNAQLLDQIAIEAQSRTLFPQAPWLDATWLGISAETARLQGHSSTASSLFDLASHQWAAMESDGRAGWVQSRVSAACAAYDANELSRSKRTLELVADEIEADHSRSTIHAAVPLLRGLLAAEMSDEAPAFDLLESAASRFAELRDSRGESFARTVLAELHIRAGNPSRESAVEDARKVFGQHQDTRGLTYAELVLGDAAFLRSSIDHARASYREALRLAEHTGDKLAHGTALHKLAHLETHVHRYDIALPLERQALRLERSSGHSTFAEGTERTIARLDALAAATPSED